MVLNCLPFRLLYEMQSSSRLFPEQVARTSHVRKNYFPRLCGHAFSSESVSEKFASLTPNIFILNSGDSTLPRAETGPGFFFFGALFPPTQFNPRKKA